MNESAPAPLLTVSSLRKTFGGLQAVDDASFTIAGESLTALIGPNGAGKSTLFDLISGFQKLDSGTVVFDGKPITAREPHEIARAGLVRTFQTTRTLRRMTVLENLMVAAPAHPGDQLWPVFVQPGRVRRAEGRARDEAMALLERVGLANLAASYAGVLSGGQRKLLELSRALMLRPRLLLLDEPFAGVNPALTPKLSDAITQLRNRERITVLFVEHDMRAVMRLADHVIVMNAGTVLTEGTPEAIRRDPRVIDAYLGVTP